MERKNRIGMIGTGGMARGLTVLLEDQPDMRLTKVLTNRTLNSCHDFPRRDLLTNSINELIDNSDIVVECSGSVIEATKVLTQVMSDGLPVVTMNSELHVTTGTYLIEKGIITEAEGDQPGCQAALREDAIQMGFRPLVYGNMKGFLNHTPTLEEMDYWSRKQGIRFEQVISFTDGTKLQIEQALVANGLGCSIAQTGMLGVESQDVNSGAMRLGEIAKGMNCAISDYILSPGSPAGVFIVAEHDNRQSLYLSYLKMGEGPLYVLARNYHLCHLEITKTIRRLVSNRGVLLNNSESPSVGVAAIAKRKLVPGEMIARGIGGFDVRGVAIRLADYPDHVPIGLLINAVVKRRIEPGQQLSFDDVELPLSFALEAWLETKTRMGVAAGTAA